MCCHCETVLCPLGGYGSLEHDINLDNHTKCTVAVTKRKAENVTVQISVSQWMKQSIVTKLWSVYFCVVSHCINILSQPYLFISQGGPVIFLVPQSLTLVRRNQYISRIIMCMHSANERRRYIVTSSLIHWVHTRYIPDIFTTLTLIIGIPYMQ